MVIISTTILSKNPVFKSFLIASTASLLGSNVFDIAMPLYVLQKTHSVWALLLINLAINLPYFVMAPITGYIIDHFDKRRVMLAADLIQVACMATLLSLELFFLPDLWLVAALVFTTKTMMICFDTVVTFQLIPGMIRESDALSDANTWFLSSQRLIQIIGPLLGGGLLSLFGIVGCITLNLASFGATLFFVYRLKNLSQIIDGESQTQSPVFPTPGRILDGFRSSITFIWGSPLFRPLVLTMFFWNLSSLCPNTPSMIYYFTEQHKFSPAQYGVITSCFGLMGIFGFLSSRLFYRVQKFSQTFLFFSAMHTFLSAAAAALFQVPALFGLCFSTSRFGSSIVSMGTFVLRQTAVPKDKTGTVNACLRMFFMSAVPLSSIIQGALIHHWGIGGSWLFGVICLLVMLYFSKQVAFAYHHPKDSKIHISRAA